VGAAGRSVWVSLYKAGEVGCVVPERACRYLVVRRGRIPLP